MNNTIFFYDMKTFHNISEEVKNAYYEIMCTKNIRYYMPDGGQRVLFILPTQEIAEREYKKMLVQTNYKRVDDREVKCIVTNNQYCFVSLNTVMNKYFLHGQRFSDIRFLG